jgi:hypothetical protein
MYLNKIFLGAHMDKEKNESLIATDDKIKSKLINRTKNYTDAVMSSAFTINAIHDDRLDLGTIATELVASARRLIEGNTKEIEMTLLSQAQTLNVLFHHMLTQITSMDMVNQIQIFADIALRAQNQSRKTLAILADLKNPRRATFIKQQNNAVNQQINNGSQIKNCENPTNELVTEVKNEKMVNRRKVKAISINKEPKAVATLHRTTDRAREIS